MFKRTRLGLQNGVVTTGLLPEDISILYNLHTLNVSGCWNLGRLPKGIKYMTALRHLYTHECTSLKCMPPELGRLTSLQTLTNFVVGTGSACSSIGELQHLNKLGGPLLLSQLENVTDAKDAKQASLGHKKDLRELSLTWTWRRPGEMEKQHCHKVLEGLEAPLGLEALRIIDYQGTNFPTWMGMLPNLVELHLYDCNRSEKLPPLGSVPVLQVLHLKRLAKVECLCSGGTFFDFPNLKELILSELPKFVRWCEVNWVQGEQIMFPQLHKLFINDCGELTALPGPTLLGRSCIGDYEEADERQLRSAFPELKALELHCLAKFQRWGETEATQGKKMIFPQLEYLSIHACKELTTLPEGPELVEAFKAQKSEDLEPERSLCGGDYGKARAAFPALKVLELDTLESFQSWGEAKAAQGKGIIFPRLENLLINSCQKLIALPEGPLLGELCGGDYEKACSAFPALKVLDLSNLYSFQRWEEVEATQRGDTMFPHLEELSIKFCRNLAALPAGIPLAVSFGRSDVTAQSALPRLMKIVLDDLQTLKSWGATEAINGEKWTFHVLDTLKISRCPELTTLPEAPKLSVLEINGSPKISASVPGVINSLSKLSVSLFGSALSAEHGAFELVDGNNKFPLKKLELRFYNLLFHSSALALWTCFVQLQDLEISCCNALVYWPEEFQSLISLRSLFIEGCYSLTGYAPGQAASVRSQLLPHLESLEIRNCEKLLQVFNMPASLKKMDVRSCRNLESIFGTKQQEEPALNKESTAAPESSSSASRDHFPSLRKIIICSCDKLQSLSGRLDALQKLEIRGCAEFRSLGEFSTLEGLALEHCRSLPSLPDGPQAYSSLRYLELRCCPGLKSLPSSLQQRLASLEETDMDARYEGAKLLKPKTWKYATCRN